MALRQTRWLGAALTVLLFLASCSASWHARQFLCGDDITLKPHDRERIITTPNYPDNAPLYSECVWRIAAPTGYKITIHFLSRFNYTNCQLEYLEIRDGVNLDAPLLERFCGDTPPTDVTTLPEHYMYVRFYTDLPSPSAIKARISIIEASPSGSIASPSWNTTTSPWWKTTSTTKRDHEVSRECHGKFTGSRGVIESPNYPRNYPLLQNCSWIIEAPQFDDKLRLNFTHFDLESGREESCPFDYLEITEGANDVPDNEIGIFCGSTLPYEIVSTRQQVFLNFKSDYYVTKSGFRLEWSVDVDQGNLHASSNSSVDPHMCGGHFYTMDGAIMSPNYPHTYPSDIECKWIIEVPHSQHVVLNVERFRLEYTSQCLTDYLEIRNESFSLIGRFCGSDIPGQITTNDNKVYLKFVTDYYFSLEGFKITWHSVASVARGYLYASNNSSVDPQMCGGHFYTMDGAIMSPNYPHTYPGDLECEWIIEVPQSQHVVLNVEQFYLEYAPQCSTDYLEIRNESFSLIGRFCGSDIPGQITTNDNKVYLKFITDYYLSLKGFKITWHSIASVDPERSVVSEYTDTRRSRNFIALNTPAVDTNICGGRFNSLQGVITSPNYPNDYPENIVCEWIIEAPYQHQVTLTFDYFYLTWQAECALDFLQIRNGGTKTSPVLGRFCGYDPLPQIRSFGNRIYLKLGTHSSTRGGGFRVEWDSTTLGCGGNSTTASGSISSPNYPEPYSHFADCNWDISVSAGNVIELMIVDVDLYMYNQCQSDFIEIYDGSGAQGQVLARHCQTNRPSYIETTSNVASIRYRSSDRYSGRGFHVSYRTGCNNKVSGLRGFIESPNFPVKYPHRSNCSWIIEAPVGYTINLNFSHFLLEASRSCMYDYLEIKEGTNDQPNREIAKFCGSTRTLPPIRSAQRQVFVRFQSDGSLANQGFRLEWNVHGSGAK